MCKIARVALNYVERVGVNAKKSEWCCRPILLMVSPNNFLTTDLRERDGFFIRKI